MNDEKFEDAAMEHEREQQWEHSRRKGKNVSERVSTAIAMDLETVHISPDAEARIINAVEALEADLRAAQDDLQASRAGNGNRDIFMRAMKGHHKRNTSLQEQVKRECNAARLATLRECAEILVGRNANAALTAIYARIDAEVSK